MVCRLWAALHHSLRLWDHHLHHLHYLHSKRYLGLFVRLQRMSSKSAHSSSHRHQARVINKDALHKHEPQIYETTDYCDYRGMQLMFLGTSSSIPTKTRNTSCIALRLEGTVYLFDCGEGVQKQLNHTSFRPIAIDNIFITHMHADHILGLPGILAGLGVAGTTKQQPINIFGPEGLRSWLRHTLKCSYARVQPKYVVHELVLQKRLQRKAAKENNIEDMHEDELPGKNIYRSKGGLWHVLNDRKYSVKAGLLRHTIPCWGYIVEEDCRPGRFDIERASHVGVNPGRESYLLQQGCCITLSNGKVVHPSDVLGSKRRGRKVVILGDTCDSNSLEVQAQGADLLVHECTILEQDADTALKRAHSTATMAGLFARAIGAHCLVLTHFSCKYEGNSAHMKESVEAAKVAFGKDKVIAAWDLLAVTVCQTDELA